jgi:hypothetical protein
VTTKKRAGDVVEPAPAPPPSSPDIALIHGVTPDGGFQILRARSGRLELGAVRPLKEGVPISGEVVKLHPRPDCPVVCDVEVALPAKELPSDRQVRQLPPAPAPVAEAVSARSGPAQVATNEYRKNWDAIWSSSPSKPKLVN